MRITFNGCDLDMILWVVEQLRDDEVATTVAEVKPYKHVDERGLYIVGDDDGNEYVTTDPADANNCIAFYLGDWENYGESERDVPTVGVAGA